MAAFLETVIAVLILFNVIVAGLGLELSRKLGKQFRVLRRIWAAFRRRHPFVTENVIGKFAEIWDNFTGSSLDFEDRFSVFCDELGDYLEALVQRAVDALERMFQLDAAEQAAALCRVPRRRVTREECETGVGRLGVTSCAVCIEEWKAGDDIRLLPACCHAFHCKCADRWIYQRELCPLCRTSVAI